MSYKFDTRQKSLTRRFLLILGFVTFAACLTLGLMIIFWDKLIQKLNMSQTERIIVGALFLLYGALRFSRLFKKDPKDEEEE
jgi:hypothetical protein